MTDPQLTYQQSTPKISHTTTESNEKDHTNCHKIFYELRLAMNAHLPLVRPLLCYARRGATPMHPKTATKQRRRTTTQQAPPETTTTKKHKVTDHQATCHNRTPQDAPSRHKTRHDEIQHQTNRNATQKTGHHETRNPIRTHNDTQHNKATQKWTQTVELTRYQREARHTRTHYNPTPLRTT